jgi:mannose-6-phosphate isomerase-like protein (cupin superfamily)
MAADYTHRNLGDVEDSAPKFGYGEMQEARFASDDMQTEQTGLSHHFVKPGKRQGFAHTHDETEEVYVVLAGSGRINVDGEVVELAELDAIRVGPGVVRAFEADDDGLRILAVGPRNTDDRGEMFPDWWGG